MSYSGRTYEEKRNFIRMPVDCRIIFKESNTQQQHEARGRNLSGAGVLFETDRRLATGQWLEISVLPGKDNVAPLDATVQVIRVVPQANGVFSIGVQITTVAKHMAHDKRM